MVSVCARVNIYIIVRTEKKAENVATYDRLITNYDIVAARSDTFHLNSNGSLPLNIWHIASQSKNAYQCANDSFRIDLILLFTWKLAKEER